MKNNEKKIKRLLCPRRVKGIITLSLVILFIQVQVIIKSVEITRLASNVRNTGGFHSNVLLNLMNY